MSSSSSPSPEPDLLEVGRIEKPHGLKGEVVVKLVTNMVAERTTPGAVFQLADGQLSVVRARPHGQRWLFVFDGVVDRAGADALRGQTLLASPLSSEGSDPGPPSATSDHGAEVVAYVHELIGRRVIDQHGTDHGPVVAVLDNPASDLLELGDGRLVPLTFYRGHDLEADTVTVDVPAGLLDDESIES